MTRTLTAVAALTVTGLALPVAASTITIDNFTVAQQVQDLPGGLVNSSTVGSAAETSILGGYRYLQVETLGNALDPGAPLGTGQTTFTAENGTLNFVNGPTAIGRGWVVYDGDSDTGSQAVVPTVAGLSFGAPVRTNVFLADLLMGNPTGSLAFNVDDIDKFDVGDFIFKAFAWDTNNLAVAYRESIDPFNFSPILPFSDFRTDWSDPTTSVNTFAWGSVTALAFSIESTVNAADGVIFSITATPIPLPASAFLLLGGLGGLAGLSAAAKRRRKMA